MHGGLQDDVLERALLFIEAFELGRCTLVCPSWRRMAVRDACWLVALARRCSKPPYETVVTAFGSRLWMDRDLGGDIVSSRGHLRRLQATRELRNLYKFLHEFHNGVEVQPSSARRAQAWYSSDAASAMVTLDILNFWPHSSWVLLRSAPPKDELDAAEGCEASVDGATAGKSGSAPEIELGGITASIRCWEVTCPPGRVGAQYGFVLDCGRHGCLFRVPALATLEVGRHRVSGHTGLGGRSLRLECAMGCWPDHDEIPLPACSADAFLRSTLDDPLLPDGDPALDAIGEEWFEGGKLPESCPLGPALYRSTVDLDLTQWL